MDPVFQNLRGITIQRVEKPKPKPESQNAPPPESLPPPQPDASDAESSFENEDEEESYSDDSFESDDEAAVHNLGDSVTIDRRVTNIPQVETFRRNVAESVSIERAPSKRVIDSSELQNFKQTLDDSVTFGKRVIDTSIVQNFKRNVDSVTIDRSSGSKRVTEVDNFKRNLGDSITIDRPAVSKRIVNASEAQNYHRSLSDSITIDKPSVGKRVIDTSEVQNYKQNLSDSISIDRPAVAKRVVDVDTSEIQNFKRNLGDSVSFDRAAVGKRVLDVTQVQNFKRNLDDSVVIDRSTFGKRSEAPNVTQNNDAPVGKRIIDTSEIQNLKGSLEDSDKHVIDTDEAQNFKRNLDESVTVGRVDSPKLPNVKEITKPSLEPENQDFQRIFDQFAAITSLSVKRVNSKEKRKLVDPVNTTNKLVPQETRIDRARDTSQNQNSKHGLDDSVTVDKLDSGEAQRLIQESEASVTIDRPKRVLNVTELQRFKGVDDLETDSQIPAKPIVDEVQRRLDDSITINGPTVTEAQNFKQRLDDPERQASTKPTEIQNLTHELDDSVAINRLTSSKRILDVSVIQNLQRGLDASVTINRPKRDDAITIERPMTDKRVIDVTEILNLKQGLDDPGTKPTEIQHFKRSLDDLITIDRPTSSKHILDVSEIQHLQRGLDGSVTINRPKPDDRPTTDKRVIDVTEIQNLKRGLNDSITIDRPATSKRIVDSSIAATKRVLDVSDLHNFTRDNEHSITIDRSASKRLDTNKLQPERPTVPKRVIDFDEVYSYKRKTDEPAIIEKPTPAHDLEDSNHLLASTNLQYFNHNPEDDLRESATTYEAKTSEDDSENSNNSPVKPQSFKRSLNDPAPPDTLAKKIKTTTNEPEAAPKSTSPVPGTVTPLSDIPTDEEEEYGSDSEFDSENELDSEIAAIKQEAAASFNKETKIDTADPTFLENLVDDSFLDKTVPDIPIKTENDSRDADDYDYDIKEKLKEMGEISFVKKVDKVKKGDETEATGGEDDVVIERKGPGGGIIASSMMRRNIREVMDEAKLDQSTLAAQREEMERLQRVQEQQRIIREVQRQMAQERVQNKMISLLQGGSLSKAGSSGTRIGNTVLVKLPNGETKSMTKVPNQPFDLVKLPKGQSLSKSPQGAALTSMKKSPAPVGGPGQLTPSVSIAPVAKRPTALLTRPYSDSEGENEDSRMQLPFSRGKAPKPSTLTTVDATSDDDCIVVSDTEAEQAMDDEVIEDPANSGMHANDEFNQPDALGRVVVNIGHPEGEPDIYLASQIARIIKPHQIGGVRFLYDNVIESINRFDSSTGFGCILAHSMGLGKTLQVICFSDIFLRHTSSKTILCILPINTLQNWLAEYNMWLPAEEDAADSSLSAQGEVRPRTFSLYVLNDSHKTITSRARVIQAWRSSGGVLLIGYEQYRLLSLRQQPKSKRKPHLVQPEDEDKNRKLLDDIHIALVMPGPDLVVCDEGHRIKNSHASISQALKQMRTKRRIVLTGYPLQNNLMEYWCMVDFVRPNYLGSKAEFCNMFERPIQNGQCMDSTEADIKLMRYRAHVLHSLLVGFVQRRSHAVLQNALPQKEEYVLLLRMTDYQRKLYNVFMNEVVRCQSVPNPLKAFAVCCKIWNHPDVLYNFIKKRAGGEAVDIDLEEVSNTSNTIVNGPVTKSKRQPKRSTTPKGRRSTKPAASVTPNNTREEERTGPRTRRAAFISQNPVPDSEFFHNENANFPSPLLNTQQSTSCPSQSSESSNQTSFANQSFSTFSSNSNSNSFQNIKQQLNLWGQNDSSNFSNKSVLGSDMFNNTNSREGLSWRKDDNKSIISNNILTSPIKSEQGSFSGSENKPKIKILSDIKLGSPFQSPIARSTPDGKKINIISDIKLEGKKEESGDDKRFSKFNMESMKNEIKPLMKPEPPPRRISEDDVKIISEMPPPAKMRGDDGQDGIPYDWAMDLVKDYIPGCLENSAKTELLFSILRESISLGDRLLLFSQSLITLDVIEQFLQMNNVPGLTEKWAKNTNYYRLDGSTSALEREKLINEFNANPKIHLFLVSTRAGSLGINLVGANRVIVFDASWNPCHDTQAVCRVYRYGQRKPCFVYRFVMDHCLEKKIYDRQINKQGMSDRVVDECNPDSHVTMKDLSTLCFDDTDEGEAKDWSCVKDNYRDSVLQKVLDKHGTSFSKQPFQHESLLVDRKDKQLSQQEKRLAKKGYEREKQASRQPTYSLGAGARSHRPVASVRPMLQGGERPSRWIPAEHWQRQGMTAQEMTLPLDVVIPTNQPDKGNIILKAGQKVLVLKSPKGVYMQLENGKIVAIKTAIKVRGKAEEDAAKMIKPPFPPMKPPLPPPNMPLLPPKRMVRPFTPGHTKLNMRSIRQPVPNLIARMQGAPRMQGPPRKPGPATKVALYPMENESPQPTSSPKTDIESKKLPLQSEISQRLIGDEITMEKFSSKSDRRAPPKPELPQNPLLKNMQQRGAISISKSSRSSTIQQLEQSTSSLISETKQRMQDISDSATSYHEEEKASASDSSSVAPIESDDMQDPEDIEDLDESYEDEELLEVSSSEMNTEEAKADGSQSDDYNYNGYYGYNQPYPHPPPQSYGSYPPHQPPPYDYGYGQQQPPYNYGMYPQGYPPQPQYPIPPPQPYDPYAPHPPPQPMYGGYHPPYPQQYPPPPNSYPPGAPPPPHNYPDYQYNTTQSPQTPPQSTNSNYYQNK